MLRQYVPWPARPPKAFRGPARIIASLAVGIYRIAAPLVGRFAGVILLGAMAAGCLASWLLALLIQSVLAVEGVLVDSGEIAAGGAMTIAQIQQAASTAGVGWPAWLLFPLQWSLIRDVIGLTGVITFVSVLAVFAIWWERKVSGHMQSRLGPMRVGGWHGWSQSPADGLKLIAKEDFIPDTADGPLFRLAPYLAFVPALAAFVALPFGASWVFRDLDIALLLILASLGIEVLGVLMAGWASNNKWSVYGAMREACQVVSYEIPMGMALLIPIMIAGSLRLNDIAAQQDGGWFNWLAFHSPWALIGAGCYFIASLASVKRAPFDLPEAESELVAGFLTEYSGFRWSLFFFGEYAAMFAVSGVLVILFFGGWDAPWAGLAPEAWRVADAPLANQLIYGIAFGGPLWFVGKCIFLLYVQLWLRWTLPRIRIDQVLYACVQVLLPLTLVLVLLSTLWEFGREASPGFDAFANVLRYVIATIMIVAPLAVLYFVYNGYSNRRALVGDMAVARPRPGG